ncbi:MAG TPA: transglutaminase domain-containing protein [Candidatus Nanoarchaeia archaeon]|nr:transglutaminase domain-containing protein [Candidatus Nanoarchaeia archaeon]
MDKKILDFYKEFSIFTNPGLYKNSLKKDLPNGLKKIGNLIRRNIIHRTTLAAGNIGTNADKKFGDMTKVPWYRQPEDDILTTASSMLAELYRRDNRGFINNRLEKDKLVVTCRFVAVLMASILKSKGIPCRVRSGNAPYFDTGKLGKVSVDHWINQYWNSKEKRWITFDVDGSWSLNDDLDPYNMLENKFDFPADAWLNIRNGKDNPNRFWNAKPKKGLIVVLWSLFYDFHCLMNDEIIYVHVPEQGLDEHFKKLSEKELKEIDRLAQLMQNNDYNFKKLQNVWNTNRKFRLLRGGLL